MRNIQVVKINPSSNIPGSIEVTGDFRSIFQGREDREFDTPIPATTFDLVFNPKYFGRYTVYTPGEEDTLESSSFAGGKTIIRVNEVIPALRPDEGGQALDTTGVITNISYYLLDTGTEVVVVKPGTDNTDYSIELFGRGASGWGEGYAQNFFNLARNFSGPIAPLNPLVGQTWYGDDNQLRTWDGDNWEIANKTSFGTTFRHTQGSPATTWTVNHGLGLAAPFIGFTQFFVDRGDGPKLIIPADVTFVNANQLTVTFTNPEIGYVLVRQ